MEEPGVSDAKSSSAHKKRTLRMMAGIVVLLIAGIGLGLWLATLNNNVAKPPSDIVRQAGFPIYMPGKLPGNYQVDVHSFMLTESVLVFRAQDGTGGVITFTEQKKPKDFDFDTFYKQQMKNTQTVNGTQFPSIAGENISGDARMVSVITDDTWIVASSQSSLSIENMHVIAQDIKIHHQD